MKLTIGDRIRAKIIYSPIYGCKGTVKEIDTKNYKDVWYGVKFDHLESIIWCLPKRLRKIK